MKNYSKLKIDTNKIIGNDELLELKGGLVDPGQWMQCSCTYGANPPFANPWEKCYSDASQAITDLGSHCIQGQGTCSNLHQWCLPA
jgi:hypothetical protein